MIGEPRSSSLVARMNVHVKIGHKICSKNNNCTFHGSSVYENLHVGIHTKIVYCDNYNLSYDRFHEKSVKFGGHLEFLYFFKFLASNILPTSFLMLYFA